MSAAHALAETTQPVKLICNLAPQVRMILNGYAASFGPRQRRPQHKNATGVLKIFMRACALEFAAGNLTRAAFYKRLTTLSWPSSKGPVLSRRCVDKWVTVFVDLGIMSEDSGELTFSFWTPQFCPTQAQLDEAREHKKASVRARVALHRNRQGVPKKQPKKPRQSSTYADVTQYLEHATAPGGTGTPKAPSHEPEFLPQHTWHGFPTTSPRVRVPAAAGFNPTDESTIAELDALDAELAAATATPKPHEPVCPEHVASADAFEQELAGLDPEIASALRQARVHHDELSTQKPAGSPHTESPPVPTDAPCEPRHPPVQATSVGHGWPEHRRVPNTKPRAVTLPEARQARLERGRDWQHLPLGDITRIMAERGVGTWQVNWLACRKWAVSESILLDAIDATCHRIMRGGVQNPAGQFIGTLRNKSRAWMRQSVEQVKQNVCNAT